MTNPMDLCKNLTVNKEGHLCFGGQDTAALASEYGTPLYLMDEDRVRENMRVYTHAMQNYFPAGSKALYASKANSFKQMYRIAAEEGMGVDVVSCGEMYTAMQAGFDLSQAYFHSNNKTDSDIAYGIEHGIGFFVADGTDEVDAIERIAAQHGIRQKILLRITPGIDCHTYEAVNTGLVDSKFGTAIETGQAMELVRQTLLQPHVELMGFHCHVGSMVFGEDVFLRTADVMLHFVADVNQNCGYMAQILDLGGGYGVRYVESDPKADISASLKELAETITSICRQLNIAQPAIRMEPGRSIVADAGLTLYTVGSVKQIPGYRNYVSIDGGMGDNPRYALYGSKYTVYAAQRMNEECTFTCSLVGRCCESGDVIQPNIQLPEGIHRGDSIAVCTTGAYNYSMASNYNRIPRPAIVMLRGGSSYVAVRRETIADVAALDE
ncbi:MAG: diaminopimelate decarboxylase [Oscillospiraceae bacterium]|nr:diaminopimelate decarboxylase [Oscillospiraceae bacterium]